MTTTTLSTLNRSHLEAAIVRIDQGQGAPAALTTADRAYLLDALAGKLDADGERDALEIADQYLGTHTGGPVDQLIAELGAQLDAPSCTACGSRVKLGDCDGCGTLCLRCAYECPCETCAAR